MKKTVIAVLCAIPLCLVSCASAPIETPEVQIEIPQTDVPETEQNEISDANEYNEESSQNQEEQNTEISDSADSEIYPEPEDFVEPEIITLEPENEIIKEEPDVTEPVENEEPPEIISLEETESSVENEEATDTEEQDISSDSPENEVTAPEENLDNKENTVEDITANDIIIEEKSSDTDSISGGIDITDDDSDSGEEYSEEEKEIIPSRSVTLKKFEYLDVTYPGTGWIYMGLTDNSKDIAYFGRKLGTKDTKFSLQARAAGTKIIHFYRNDPLTGQYLDDYVEVIVLSENGSNKTHIDAPEYKLPVQKKEKPVQKTEETAENNDENTEEPEKLIKAAESETPVTVSKSQTQNIVNESEKNQQEETVSREIEETNANTESPAATSNPAILLQDAQVLYNEKEFKAALAKLNQFFEFSTDNRDEALYLKGQILEAKSDVRDIKGAIDAYTTLTKNYPASKFWDSASKRIIYLKRFYLEVRQIL